MENIKKVPNNQNINEVEEISKNKTIEEEFEEINEAKKAKKAKKQWKISKAIDIALTVVLGVVTSLTARKFVVSSRDYIDNAKFMPKVANELNADMQIMQFGESQFDLARLKPNVNNKISVYIANSVPEKTREVIKNSLSYYNGIFDYINDDYNLEVCSYPEFFANKAITNSTIKFEYKVIDNTEYGKNNFKVNKTLINKLINPDGVNKNVYIVDSTIYLNKTYFDKMNAYEQESVINHELLHSFGFKDTYEGYNDETSLINTNFSGVINEISPNDYKMLYTAYGKKHINSDGSFNQEKMNEVKAHITEYEDKYYEKLVSIIKEEVGVEFEKIETQDIQNFTGQSRNICVELDETGKNFSFYDRYVGNSGAGRVIIGEDYAILPDIKSNNYNDFYILLKHNSKVKIYNIDIYHFEKNNTNEVEITNDMLLV